MFFLGIIWLAASPSRALSFSDNRYMLHIH